MAVAGWILFALGVAFMVLGLIIGAREAFKKQNEPGAQAALPTGIIEVIEKLLEAPPAKFFTIIGFVLVVVGLSLNGVVVFDSKNSAS